MLTKPANGILTNFNVNTIAVPPREECWTVMNNRWDLQ